MIAAVARAIACGSASSGGGASGSPSSRGGGAASMRSRSAARSASSSADGPGADLASSSGRARRGTARRRVATSCTRPVVSAGGARLPAGRAAPARTASSNTGHGCPRAGDVRSEPRPATRRTALGGRPARGREPRRRRVRRRRDARWHRAARQLQRRHLGQGGPVDVVAGDGAPHVRARARRRRRLGRRGRVLGRRRPNRSKPPRTPLACTARATGRKHHGRLDRCRRAAGEQAGGLVGADPPRFAVSQQIAGGHQVAAVRRQVPACRVFEVRQRARRRGPRARHRRARSSSTRLQRKVLRQLARTGRGRTTGRPPGASAARERLLGGLGPSAQLGVQAGDQLHHERRRRRLGRGAGSLADAQWAHVQAAVHELRLHADERQAVALHGSTVPASNARR